MPPLLTTPFLITEQISTVVFHFRCPIPSRGRRCIVSVQPLKPATGIFAGWVTCVVSWAFHVGYSRTFQELPWHRRMRKSVDYPAAHEIFGYSTGIGRRLSLLRRAWVDSSRSSPRLPVMPYFAARSVVIRIRVSV